MSGQTDRSETRAQECSRECVKAFREQLDLSRRCLREVVEQLCAENTTVTFSMIRRRLNRRARRGGRIGEASFAISSYLGALDSTDAPEMFDLAVVEGTCPLWLVEQLFSAEGE